MAAWPTAFLRLFFLGSPELPPTTEAEILISFSGEALLMTLFWPRRPEERPSLGGWVLLGSFFDTFSSWIKSEMPTKEKLSWCLEGFGF